MSDGVSPRSAALAHCPRQSQRNAGPREGCWLLLVIHDSGTAFSLGNKRLGTLYSSAFCSSGTLFFSGVTHCPG